MFVYLIHNPGSLLVYMLDQTLNKKAHAWKNLPVSKPTLFRCYFCEEKHWLSLRCWLFAHNLSKMKRSLGKDNTTNFLE